MRTEFVNNYIDRTIENMINNNRTPQQIYDELDERATRAMNAKTMSDPYRKYMIYAWEKRAGDLRWLSTKAPFSGMSMAKILRLAKLRDKLSRPVIEETPGT